MVSPLIRIRLLFEFIENSMLKDNVKSAQMLKWVFAD